MSAAHAWRVPLLSSGGPAGDGRWAKAWSFGLRRQQPECRSTRQNPVPRPACVTKRDGARNLTSPLVNLSLFSKALRAMCKPGRMRCERSFAFDAFPAKTPIHMAFTLTRQRRHRAGHGGGAGFGRPDSAPALLSPRPRARSRRSVRASSTVRPRPAYCLPRSRRSRIVATGRAVRAGRISTLRRCGA